MLVKFTVENWMSFRDKNVFSLIGTREKQHKERLPFLNNYKINILPIAAVYGGNASGKTNYFKALNFVKDFIVRGSLPDSLLPVEPFLLDSKASDNPTSFIVELLVGETIYEFSFTANRKAILEEKLIEITNNKEIVLYNREGNKAKFDKSLSKDQFLDFAFRGTRDNQLFLTNSVSQKVEEFRPIYNWFKDSLVLIAPDSRFASFEFFLDEEHKNYSLMNKILSRLDTGIDHLGFEETLFNNIPLPESLKLNINENVKESMTIRLMDGFGNQRFVISRKKEELIAKKVISYHKKTDGTNAKFEIAQESDGSRRILDLLPAFLEISGEQSEKVYVIDEIDRSLHSILTRQLLEYYLKQCSSESRSQLLFTTHDVLLMDQELLRRDEMWITERDSFGISSLLSFSEFKDVRYDKDIRKSYLQGRLGGIPRILIGSTILRNSNFLNNKA